MVYFGVWSDPEGALRKYLAERDTLQAGMVPSRKSDTVNVGELVNRFLDQCDSKVQSDTISPRTFRDYRDAPRLLVERFGRESDAASHAMGHADNTMAGNYRQPIDDSRI